MHWAARDLTGPDWAIWGITWPSWAGWGLVEPCAMGLNSKCPKSAITRNFLKFPGFSQSTAYPIGKGVKMHNFFCSGPSIIIVFPLRLSKNKQFSTLFVCILQLKWPKITMKCSFLSKILGFSQKGAYPIQTRVKLHYFNV